LNAGRYLEGIAVYRQAVAERPELRDRIKNLVSVFKNAGDLEVAYCLDPSDKGLGIALESAGTRHRGLCAESKQP